MQFGYNLQMTRRSRRRYPEGRTGRGLFSAPPKKGAAAMKTITRTKRLFAAAFAACLLLAGCAAPDSEAPAEKGDAIRFLSSDQPYGSGNEAGYYYFAKDENGNSLLRVVDYASLQDVPLCSQPNCAHRDESCPAWFAWGGADPSVLAADDELYILFPGAPWNGWAFETYGEKALPRILKCGTDGSNRQELVCFSASDAFASMPATDGKNLYVILTDYSGTDKAVEKILTIDLASGSVSADESVQRTELRIAGAWGRELILQSGSGSNYYAAYNVDTKALRDLASSDSTAIVGEGVVCCADEATGAIRTVSVADGSAAELATDLLDQCAPQWLKLAGVTEQGYVLQVSQEDGYHNWLIDFEGRAHRQELQAESTNERDQMRMLEIFARKEGEYLVSPSRSFCDIRTPGPNGVTYGEEAVDYAFALISAEDFWAGTPNYRAVTRVG